MAAFAPLEQFDMRALIDDVAREIVMADIEGREGLIALPSVYPGGASVVVRVQHDDGQFIVHDGGEGYLAAEHLGGPNVFRRVAPAVAQARGVEFDGHMFFKGRVTRDWLANMVVFVGDATRRAVEVTAERLTEERVSDRRRSFKALLSDAFRSKIVFDFDRVGQSGKPWEFTAGVRLEEHVTLFDFVTGHPHSINGAVTRFQDVYSPEVRTIAALPSMGTTAAHDIALLSRWATKVLPSDAPEEAFRLAA